jgi:glycerophosphoryl diester phosphodiesterase
MPLLILLASGLCWSAPERFDRPAVYPPYSQPTVIAHRGASFDAPEHTIAAYTLALKAGADFVEPDLQMTKDGVLICMHDTSLERTTNVAQVFPNRVVDNKGKKTWPVVNFTLAEIKTLDAGSWKGRRFAGARVPTFQEMINLVKGKAGLYPETKAPEVYGKHGLDMERALMEILKAKGLDQPRADPKTPIVIQSFSARSLQLLRSKYGCKLPLIYLTDAANLSKDRLREIHKFATGIGPKKSTLAQRPGLVDEAHALGMSVTVWTFRAKSADSLAEVRAEMAHYLHDLHVDAVFTDNPDQFPRPGR